MTNINSPSFDIVRQTIKSLKENMDWEAIKTMNTGSLEQTQIYIDLQTAMKVFPEGMTIEDWKELISSEKEAEIKKLRLENAEEDTIIISPNADNQIHVPQGEKSSWQLYKNHLLNSGWSLGSVQEIENATIHILKKLSRDTSESGPVKGLVIGHVQSGKTANMAALTAMAADWGWNMFIVLSGMIENLRKQTQERLIKDLNHPGNLSWISLERISGKSAVGNRAQDLVFDDKANQRYLTVCLKNKTRLSNLIAWMHADKNKLKDMRIIVIDDEADQGGINTMDVNSDERAAINKLIVELVDGNNSKYKPQAINYISYTATPYSNFLNESGQDSLYPKDFIGSLKPSNEYIGPKQIFGVQETESNYGMNIVRKIDEEDLTDIKLIHDEGCLKLPSSFIESICWFLCSAAALRSLNYKKPVSMLIHTSQKQVHHANIATAVETWISKTDAEDLLKNCEKVYRNETNRFTLKDFRNSYREYNIPDEKINNYPDFETLKNEILVLKKDISHIRLGEEGHLKYSDGIHLCIDNCANNGITEDNMYVRLAYPDPKMENYPSPAPAFIVIGGSTLSRGLTIEGLVSTYFLRSSTQADSLMQMGRWFGYRKGYELFPKIWMTSNTYEKFEFLATLEEELREDLKRFSELGHSPAEVGPRVKNSPKASWMKVTAKNKMQGAKEINMDFTGTSNQTVIFSKNNVTLSDNIKITNTFLHSLGSSETSWNNSALIWRNVDFNVVKNEFLLKFNFHPRSRVFNQMDIFCKWVEETTENTGFTKWNVVVSSRGNIDGETDRFWKVDGKRIGLVNRSQKKNNMQQPNSNTVSIGVLRAPTDLYADLHPNDYIKYKNEINSNKLTKEKVDRIREQSGLESVPQLLFYMIDKDSKARESKSGNSVNQNNRADLDFPEDIVGVSIYIPGKKMGNNFAKALTVDLSDTDISFNKGDLGTDGY